MVDLSTVSDAELMHEMVKRGYRVSKEYVPTTEMMRSNSSKVLTQIDDGIYSE